MSAAEKARELGFVSTGRKWEYQERFGEENRPDTLSYDDFVARFPEIFRPSYDPRQLVSWEPPPEVKAALEDVFGDEARSGKVIVALHPHFKRPALFEFCNRDDGAAESYHCFWVCGMGEAPHADYVASDHDPRLHWAVRGLAGEFRLPTKFDFEVVKNHADTRGALSAAERAALNGKERQDIKKSIEARTADKIEAKVDYECWRQNVAPAVSMHLDGDGLSKQELEVRARTVVFDHKGFPIRVAIGSADELRYLEELAALRVDREAQAALASGDVERVRKQLAIEVREADR